MVSLSGCSTLQPIAAPRQFIGSAQPARIWVTRADGSTLAMDSPRLLGDTLVGWVGGRYEEILLPEASRVLGRRPAPRRTAFLIGGVVAVGALLIGLLASTGPQGYQPTPEGSVTAP
jgi:hypothetical protein